MLVYLDKHVNVKEILVGADVFMYDHVIIKAARWSIRSCDTYCMRWTPPHWV